MISTKIIGACGAILVLAAATSAAAADLRVYRPDGSLQCNQGQARTLDQDKAVLESLGAHVVGQEKRQLPFKIIQMCGAPTGQANTYVISEADWQKIRRGFVGPAKFGLWIFDSKTAVVYKYDGTILCAEGSGIKLDDMAKELTSAGIAIISQKKATDGLMHIQLCGSITGSVNAYEIASSDLQKALDLGFSYLITPQTATSIIGEADSKKKALAAPAARSAGWPLPWPFPW
ncbi:hypothetical protein H8B02_45105 [Bradyrhizobium sp. Pear77]|uniref:hypothetical protein n=1 Tax=Bradyrhizobium altum TaxID=1571202 RepID=UPI001E442116|nr:hypothetical protein [Bradyrhizobium altum]MCC8960330.1 hypothetical protein [Bradyrhizobium altum]